jgi:hypothetical protein
VPTYPNHSKNSLTSFVRESTTDKKSAVPRQNGDSLVRATEV